MKRLLLVNIEGKAVFVRVETKLDDRYKKYVEANPLDLLEAAKALHLGEETGPRCRCGCFSGPGISRDELEYFARKGRHTEYYPAAHER